VSTNKKERSVFAVATVVTWVILANYTRISRRLHAIFPRGSLFFLVFHYLLLIQHNIRTDTIAKRRQDPTRLVYVNPVQLFYGRLYCAYQLQETCICIFYQNDSVKEKKQLLDKCESGRKKGKSVQIYCGGVSQNSRDNSRFVIICRITIKKITNWKTFKSRIVVVVKLSTRSSWSLTIDYILIYITHSNLILPVY